jgi:ankyrin repeat protein
MARPLNYLCLYPESEIRIRMAECLLKHGASPDCLDTIGFTPLDYSAIDNEVSTADLLLRHGADPNLENLAGNTLLYNATRYGALGTVELLIKYGASPMSKSMTVPFEEKGYSSNPITAAAKLRIRNILSEAAEHEERDRVSSPRHQKVAYEAPVPLEQSSSDRAYESMSNQDHSTVDVAPQGSTSG